jgi:hypothetical protein
VIAVDVDGHRTRSRSRHAQNASRIACAGNFDGLALFSGGSETSSGERRGSEPAVSAGVDR